MGKIEIHVGGCILGACACGVKRVREKTVWGGLRVRGRVGGDWGHVRSVGTKNEPDRSRDWRAGHTQIWLKPFTTLKIVEQ